MMNIVINNKSGVSKVNTLALLLAILVFIRIRPYYFWPYEDIMRPFCAIVIMVISLTNFSREKYRGLIFSLLVFSYVWASLFVDGSPIITILNFIGFAFVPLIRKSLILDTYGYFKKIFCVVLLLSILNYLMSQIGLNINLGMIQYENGPQTISFMKQPFYIKSYEQSFGLPRFNGVFDEPGVIGTVCALLLICDRMRFKDKCNLILLVGGVLSFSFFFYVSLILGMAFFSMRSKNSRRWMFALAILAVISYYIPQVYNTIWARFEWDAQTGTFVGDNRQSQVFLDFWDSIKDTPLLITGVGAAVAEEYIGASASLLVVIVKHGLLFVVPIILSFFIMSYREIKDKKVWIIFIIYFLLTIYQRPGFYSTYSMALYTMVIYQLSNSSRNEGKS